MAGIDLDKIFQTVGDLVVSISPTQQMFINFQKQLTVFFEFSKADCKNLKTLSISTCFQSQEDEQTRAEQNASDVMAILKELYGKPKPIVDILEKLYAEVAALPDGYAESQITKYLSIESTHVIVSYYTQMLTITVSYPYATIASLFTKFIK